MKHIHNAQPVIKPPVEKNMNQVGHNEKNAAQIETSVRENDAHYKHNDKDQTKKNRTTNQE